MKPLYFLVAQASIVDRETNTGSIVNITETLTIQLKPEQRPEGVGQGTVFLIPYRLVIASLWSADNQEERDNPQAVTVRMISPLRELAVVKARVDFEGLGRSRLTLVMDEVPVDVPGIYSYVAEFLSEGVNTTAKWDLEVTIPDVVERSTKESAPVAAQ